ncbi:MAG: hypothetical protein FWC15_05170 [Fibromonadales bacterium]|nr:hypothetical protein [Fibromonadales bacterium]
MSKQMKKIEARLAKLERQKGYIFGMWVAEHELAKNGKIEYKSQAYCDGANQFDGKDSSLIEKGYKSQFTEIEKRAAKAEMEERNLFKNL